MQQGVSVVVSPINDFLEKASHQVLELNTMGALIHSQALAVTHDAEGVPFVIWTLVYRIDRG